jgi:hypothetical protein
VSRLQRMDSTLSDLHSLPKGKQAYREEISEEWRIVDLEEMRRSTVS